MSDKSTLLKLVLLLAVAGSLSACGSKAKGVRFIDGKSTASKTRVEAVRNLSEAEVKAVILGKTFQYTRSDGNGFITYGSDGTFDFHDDEKGAGSGTWSVTGGQFCESYAGAPTDCGEFKYTGDAYFAAKSRLVEMKL